MSCSFCNSYSHNIRGCLDPMIGILFERMKVIYVDMMNQYPNDTENRFKSVLNRRFNLRELRAVCATYTNFPSSRPKQQIINVLYHYYSSRIYNLPRQDEGQPWLDVRRLPTQPDPVPDFARDLEQPPEEEDHDITWYIDTTPSPVSVLTFGSALIQDRLTSPRHITYNHDDVWLRLGRLGLRGQQYQDIMVARSLNAEFDAVASLPQIKKYNIRPVLVLGEEEGEEDCAICYESIKCVDLVKLNCEHKFCGVCIKETLKSHSKLCGPSCALCRKQMESFTVKNQEIYNLVSEHCNL